MKNKALLFLTLVIGLIGTGVIILTMNTGAANPSTVAAAPVSAPLKQRPVTIEKVKATPLKRSTTYPGSIRAWRETQLAFRVSGPLVHVNIKAGDRVKAGQVLMQIDPKDFNDSIHVLEAQLEGALAQEENARQDLGRVTQLFREKVIPKADFDHATTAGKAAAAAVRQIRAGLETARHQLEYTTLQAPYDGIITTQLIENHEMVRAGQVVLKIHDISELEISINVSENEIIHHSLTRGEPGMVSLPGIEGRTFPARLEEWNTQADALTRTYEVTFRMTAPGDVRILPGMTAEVAWQNPDPQAHVISIPARAVISDSSRESLVWLFNPATSTASRTEVTLGRLGGQSRVTVLSGLSPGDLIVTRGMDFITQDMILTDVAPVDGQTTGIN